MRNKISWFVLLCSLCSLFFTWARVVGSEGYERVQEPFESKVLLETWDNRHTEQGRLGWVHLRCVSELRDGKKVIRSDVKDLMKYLRSGDPYEEKSERYTVETEAGEVLELGYRLPLGKKQALIVRGIPQGEKITLEVLDQNGEKAVYRQEKPWNTKALGIYATERFFAGKPLSPGASLEFLSFDSAVNAVIPSQYKVLAEEEVEVSGTKRKLMRTELTYPKELHLDKSLIWLDPKSGETLRIEEESSIFGKIIHERSTKEMSLATFAGDVKDKETPVSINKKIPIGLLGLPKQLKVRIELSEDDDPSGAFAQDRRQVLVKKEGKTAEFLLGSKPLKEAPAVKENAPGKEFLSSNFYIRSDDELIKRRAKEVVGTAKTDKDKMKRITQWVGKKVKGNYEIAFATADEVAKTMEGDCTEMGVLAAAMGRAQNIPTRVCFGLVYDPENPGFGGHLWTEAWIDGQWETYDPTGVIPALSAAYIKIGAFSFDGIISPDEITLIRRAFQGKMKVDLLDP